MNTDIHVELAYSRDGVDYQRLPERPKLIERGPDGAWDDGMDHVSMGAAAAIKTWYVLQDGERVLAIELFTAAQALEFRRPARSSAQLESFVSAFRERVPYVNRCGDA